MSAVIHTTCPICTEDFEEGDIVITFRSWPQSELLGHAGCVASISMYDEEEDEE
ncbi:MAG TPA: hypothetical protein VHU23_01145 [Rhizomicrobium sp.]|jgi:hypothetical protein|nr:hypothetical protein [Rhizomicrobium sp.]